MVFSLFFCRLRLPPKRSNRIRNLSPRKKARRVAVQPNPTNQDLSSVASTNHSATSSSTAAVGPQPIFLSPGILDELVTRVADEVTRRLSPTNETSTTPINTSRPSDLSQMPLVSNAPPPDSGAWYISCNYWNGWCLSAWAFKQHTSFIVG